MRLATNRFGIKQIKLDFGAVNTMKLEYDDQESESLAMGYRSWRYTPMKGLPYYSINAINRMQGFAHGFTAAASYAWTLPKMLEVCVHYVDWISGLTFNFDFEKNEVTIRDTYPNSKPEIIPFTIL